MTAQIPDILIHRGQQLDLCATPLDPYLARLPKTRRPHFAMTSTSLRRGYIATWQIIDRRLYLVALEGAVNADSGLREVGLADVFPWRQRPILATWVDARLSCPEGRMRVYVHAAFASVYERNREFDVTRGIVEREFLVHNPPAPLVYEILPDGQRVYHGEPVVLPSGHSFDPRPDGPSRDPFPDNAPIEPWRLWGDPNWGFEEGESYVVLAATTGLQHLGSGGNGDRS